LPLVENGRIEGECIERIIDRSLTAHQRRQNVIGRQIAAAFRPFLSLKAAQGPAL
jgi:hypothetical protein